MRDTTIMQQNFPNGPPTDEMRAWWDYHTDQDWCAKIGGCPDWQDNQGWFAKPGDVVYLRVRHDSRARAGCERSWLGIDWNACASGDVANTINSSKDDAPVIKFTLHTGLYQDAYLVTGYPCYVWSAQIEMPGHACHGFYLDQNMKFSFSFPNIGLTYKTKWKRNRDSWGVKFSNDPRTIDEINDWNVNHETDRFYMDFWRRGKLQVPRKYYPYYRDGGSLEWTETDRSCHCLDGRCNDWILAYNN